MNYFIMLLLFILTHWLILDSWSYYIIFDYTEELPMSIRIPTKEAKAEIKTLLVAEEAKISRGSV